MIRYWCCVSTGIYLKRVRTDNRLLSFEVFAFCNTARSNEEPYGHWGARAEIVVQLLCDLGFDAIKDIGGFGRLIFRDVNQLPGLNRRIEALKAQLSTWASVRVLWDGAICATRYEDRIGLGCLLETCSEMHGDPERL